MRENSQKKTKSKVGGKRTKKRNGGGKTEGSTKQVKPKEKGAVLVFRKQRSIRLREQRGAKRVGNTFRKEQGARVNRHGMGGKQKGT